MHIPVRFQLMRFVMLGALAWLAGCAVNQSGLDSAQGSAGAGTTGGRGAAGGSGSGGTLAIGGTTGSGTGVGGSAGTNPVDSAGAAGTGAAGTGGGGGVAASGTAGTGEAGTTGTAGSGDAGTTGTAGSGDAGTTGAAGSGDAGSGVAGSGAAGSGSAGSGAGGSAGRGGAGGRGTGGCGPSTCANGCCQNNQCVTQENNQACGTGGVQCGVCAPCHRCGAGNACEVSPSATWNVICQSATIQATKPNGAMWDSQTAFPGSNPDPFCQLSTSDGRTRSSPVVMDSLSPFWNANVAPTSGGGLTTTLLLTPGDWTIAILDQDGPSGFGGTGSDAICSVMPSITAAMLNSGVVSFSNVESCTQLTLDITCAQ